MLVEDLMDASLGSLGGELRGGGELFVFAIFESSIVMAVVAGCVPVSGLDAVKY